MPKIAKKRAARMAAQGPVQDHAPPSEGNVKVVIAIDPGEVHCGVALFEDGLCADTWEMGPAALLKWLKRMLRAQCVDVLVVEQFRLYPWMAEQQSFSSLPTVEVIGVLRYLWATEGCKSADSVVVRQARDSGGKTVRGATALEWVTWVENPATIKEPCDGICKAKGITLVSDTLKRSGHARDAELHGHYYLLHQEGQVPTYAVGRGGNPAEVVIVEQPGAAKKPKPSKRATKGVSKHVAGMSEPVKKRAAVQRAAKKVDKMSGKTAAQILGRK